MKKILLSLMLIAALASLNTAKAQCDLVLSNLQIDATPGVEIGVAGDPLNPLRCQTTFNAEFDITTNSGFKFLFFHSWLDANYPDVFTCGSAHTPNKSPGNVTQLGTSIYQAGASILDFGFVDLELLDFELNDEVIITDNIALTGEYPNNDNNSGLLVALNTAQTATITRTADNVLHFKVTGIVVEVLGVCGPLKVTTDVWGSNAEVGGGNVPSKSKIGAQCYLCGQKTSLNDPTLALFGGACGNPRQFEFSVTTNVPQPIAYTFKVYYHDVLAPFGDYLVYSRTETLSSDGTGGFPASFFSLTQTVDYATYPDFYEAANPAANWGSIRLDVTSSLFANAVSTGNLEIDCATLPVNMKSFTASRKNSSSVGLKWETAQEENSKGFFVERKLSNGGWQSVAFVETKAIRGNSSLPLAYEFTDPNDAKGISQYRLRQIDIDGKHALSQIRAVRGEGQKAKTIIYPNPSGDGKVNIVFENVNSSRDVSLMDVSGKTLKQWKGVTNNNIQIDNLNSGFYTIRIVNNETGEQVVEKFIVNKR